MDLAVRHFIAMKGIFAPKSRQCHSTHDLDRLSQRAARILRERCGELKAEDVPQAISTHWKFIVYKHA